MRLMWVKIIKKKLAVLCCIIVTLTGLGLNTSGAEATSYFVEAFDSKSGMYTETFASGRQFMTTLPNGGQTYDGVILNIPKDITATLKQDGHVIDFTSGNTISQKGYYTVSLSTKDVISNEDVYALYTFRIMGTPAKGRYNAVYNCPMLECVNTVESDVSTGMYKYTFPNYKAFFSTVPDYNAEVSSASFMFPNNVGYSLKRNGVPISVSNNKQFTSPGNYELTVYGKNYSVAEGYQLVYETKLNFTIPDVETDANISANLIESTDMSSDFSSADLQTEYTAPVTESEEMEDTLSETYNSDANLYKETFSNSDSFYSNISNNGISGGNVYIDIPDNMTVAMTKDGLAVPFQNRTLINEQGTYILNITSSLGGTPYKARFSFRIQEGVEASGGNIQTGDTTTEPATELTEGVLGNIDYNTSHNSGITNTYNAERNMFEYTIGEEKVYTNMPVGMFANYSLKIDVPDDLNCSVTKDGEDYEFSSEMSESGEYTVYINDMDGNSLTLYFSLYDRAVNSLESFEAPAGYKITDLVYEDYKGIYQDEVNPEEDMDLSEDATEVTTVETAEEDGSREDVAEIWKSGTELIDAQAYNAVETGIDSVVLPLDGKYSIKISGENLPSIIVEIMIDRTLPQVTFEGLDDKMRSTGNEVTAICDEEGVAMSLFSESGEETVLSENGGSVTFKGLGKYTLIAVDEAGNQSSYEFSIVRHIGPAGVGAIVLFIVIIAGVGVFMIYNSKKFSVR